MFQSRVAKHAALADPARLRIVDLLTLGDYYDIALRDFGLFVAALALARLATPASAR